MDKRRYLLIRGWSYNIAIFALLIIFAFQEIDQFGLVFGLALLLLLSYKSYLCFRELKITREEDRVFAPSTDASTTEKISYYKKILLIGIPAFFILSVWTYIDLKSLEKGTVEYMSVWAPIFFLYNLGGFWTAVLATPLLGCTTLILLLKKINDLKKA
ncbi:hypothetical protein DMB65_03375 [Flavobacterium cheongpyeongense]|uniref:Uncharacterized protein n=1 Tax=Flavobacterium cheongpyeongense TaxID=2212651 RepID=A0A2V4BUK4_9FLAO|nr:hypothetical protein [Flavobacterium cheongpyeongense]PXY42282.1 hypothetical protein DMB65_03375 [Flavobacterium cheongpyeongense]